VGRTRISIEDETPTLCKLENFPDQNPWKFDFALLYVPSLFPHIPTGIVSFLGNWAVYLTTCETLVHGLRSSHPLHLLSTTPPTPSPKVHLLVIPCHVHSNRIPPPTEPHPLLNIFFFLVLTSLPRYALETSAIVAFVSL
jgi:hypothetical protein